MSKFLRDILNIPVLTEKNIYSLKHYKYASCEYTPLDKLINHFWKFSVRFVPTVSINHISFPNFSPFPNFVLHI